MNEEILRIQKMVAEGKVTPAEATELLEAMGAKGERSPPPAPFAKPGTDHVKIVGTLYVIFAAFGLVGAIFLLLMFMGIGGLVVGAGGGTMPGLTVGGVGLIIALFLAMISLPGLIGGIGLLKGKSWAKVLILIVSAFHLLDIPLGTALALYAFWALTRPEVKIGV